MSDFPPLSGAQRTPMRARCGRLIESHERRLLRQCCAVATLIRYLTSAPTLTICGRRFARTQARCAVLAAREGVHAMRRVLNELLLFSSMSAFIVGVTVAATALFN